MNTSTDYKSLIVYNFTILSNKYKTQDTFKHRAYNKALNQLRLVDNIFSSEDVKHVGGAKIQEKIKYIIEHNKNIAEVDEYISNDSYRIVESFQKIHGIGPHAAKELYEKHNIKSIEELKENTHLLNNIQQTGLAYYDHIEKKIPYKEMCKHDVLLTKLLQNIEFSIAGSYRRKASESSDIDVLITGKTNNLNDVIQILIKNKYINDKAVFASGNVKFMGLCKLPKHKTFRRIDILYTSPEEYPFALLYFTGNFKFNVDMRKHAVSKGYTLNEQSIHHLDTKKKVEHVFENEKDIFDFLEYPYVDPVLRTS